MKTVLVIPLILCLLTGTASAQINPATGTTNDRYFTTLIFNNKTYMPDNGSLSIRSYDGVTVTHHSYPSALQIYDLNGTLKSPLIEFNSSIYTVFQNTTSKFLYRFNGTTFTSISTPYPVLSNAIVYNGKLFILVDATSSIRLLSYNGTSFTEEASFFADAGLDNFQLLDGGENLYLSYIDDVSGSAVVRKYNGSFLSTIPPLPNFDIHEIISMPGTQNILIHIPGFFLYHFDGTSLDELFGSVGYKFTGLLAWDSAFYFHASYEPVTPGSLYKYESGVLTNLSLPSGAYPPYSSEPTLYDGKLYITATQPDLTQVIYSYDGVAFTLFHNYGPYGIWTEPWLGTRNGNLIMIPDTRNGTVAYEYNGSTFSTINTTSGERITKYIGKAGCDYVWRLSFPSSPPYQYGLGMEDSGTCGYPIIPDRLRHYERIDIITHARERDWCWTGIDINWIIDPICPIIPCPKPGFQISLVDNKGKIAWQDEIYSPSKVKFPLNDELPYHLLIGTPERKSFKNVIALENSLVSLGIENIGIQLQPQKKYFRLIVRTEKNKKVPVVMSLLNDSGKVIWEEKFLAPLDTEVNAIVKEKGHQLVIKPYDKLPREFQEYGIKGISFYPNPASQKIMVNIESPDEFLRTTATVRMTDLSGLIVSETEYKKSGIQEIELSSLKPGLYVIVISVGETIKRELIQIK